MEVDLGLSSNDGSDLWVSSPLPEVEGLTREVKKYPKTEGEKWVALAKASRIGTVHMTVATAMQQLNFGGAVMRMDFRPAWHIESCCKEIQMVQAIRIDVGGKYEYIPDDQNPNIDTEKERKISKKFSQNGWHIDHFGGKKTPYNAKRPGGWGFPPGDLLAVDNPLWAFDKKGPQMSGQEFITCAICREGAHVGRVYACTTWGWEYVPSGPKDPSVYRLAPSKIIIPKESKEIPGAWLGAVKMWNSRGDVEKVKGVLWASER
jgi:hypothetical protein